MNGPAGPFEFAAEEPRGGKRGRILSILRDELRKVPTTEIVSYAETRAGIDIQVAATFNLSIFVDGLVDAEGATIYANWWPQATGKAQFKFHYVESTGFNCGWHRQENDHVEGLDHFQIQTDPDGDYEYEPVEFGQTNPTGLVWEIAIDRLTTRVRERHDPNTRLSEFY
jgi:hypothetical protein